MWETFGDAWGVGHDIPAMGVGMVMFTNCVYGRAATPSRAGGRCVFRRPFGDAVSVIVARGQAWKPAPTEA